MKKIPFFEYPKLWNSYNKEYISIIDKVASSGGFILQKELLEFEISLAKFTGANHSVGVGNATDAMEIFLEAIDLKKGDEIIISSHTMLATASAIKVAGGIPVPVSGLIDIPTRTDCVLCNHTFGSDRCHGKFSNFVLSP